jgi:hypothetical protein
MNRQRHQMSDALVDVVAKERMLRSHTLQPMRRYRCLTRWFDVDRHVCSPLRNMCHLTTAGDDASAMKICALPVPSAGTTHTSDVVASDPGRDSA